MKKKPKKAVALRYDAGKDKAPRVSAKGQGLVAEKIIQLARENGIPVKDDPDLVEILAGLELEAEIPPSVYIVVAELLAFAYSVNGKKQPA